jgi:hypothetical protein
LKIKLPFFFIFVAFSIFVTLSNYFDWDFFYSTFEVDLRSWLLDLKPPIWSYQFCGGVTRIGDPQAFGMSPLIILNILFGSFWGAKMQVILASLVGFVYFIKITNLFQKSLNIFNDDNSFITNSIAIFYVFSNLYLWQSHHGHVTFLLIHYWTAVVYYILKNYLSVINKQELVLASFIFYLVASAGLYHSLVFFWLPISFSLLVSILLLRVDWKKHYKPIAICFIGTLAASYKIYHVIKYQQHFPRTVTESLTEMITPFDTFVNLAIPTLNYKYFGIFAKNQLWGIWEYSAFSFNFLFLMFYLIRAKSTYYVISNHKGNYKRFILLFCFITFITFLILSFGSFASFAPFAIINKLIFHDSVRVTGRFFAGIVFSLSLFLASFIPLLSKNHKRIFKTSISLCLCLQMLNFLTFKSTTSISSFKKIIQLQASPLPMSKFALVPLRNNSLSFMLPALKSGYGVYNCYNPLTFNSVVAKEFGFNPILAGKAELSFINEKTISAECMSNSYFTQNELYIDPSCPKNVCINVNQLNLYNQDSLKWLYNDQLSRFCRE